MTTTEEKALMNDHAIYTARGEEPGQVFVYLHQQGRGRRLLTDFRGANAVSLARSYAEREANRRAGEPASFTTRPDWATVPSDELEITARSAWVW